MNYPLNDYLPGDYDETAEEVAEGPDAAHAIPADRTAAFILAGNATFTATSPKTGARFTFKVRVSKQKEGDTRPPVHFVSVMTGPDNEDHFEFFGTVFGGDTFRHGAKARVTSDAPSAKAFAWIFPRVIAEADLHGVEIHHEGKCGRCGRKLTVPESIEIGLGPVCAGR